ncbi:MAG: LuxR C-terminal-related transcriptional regulator [Pseudoxanthomonas sp.]
MVLEPAEASVSEDARGVFPKPLGEVERPVLVARILEAAERARVVWIEAPAGFGKTVLLRQAALAAEARLGTLWLSLSQTRDSASRLALRLQGMLRRFVPENGQWPATEPDGNALIGLLALCNRIERPFLLFIDDLGGLADVGVQDVLRRFALSLPDGAGIVIASRQGRSRDLGLPDGVQVRPLLPETLCFDLNELSAVVEARTGMSDTSRMMRLLTLTEGWPGAVVLLCEKGLHEVERADMSQGLRNYIDEEVLYELPAHLREFLLDVGVLDRLDADACDRIRGCEDAAQSLEQLHYDHCLLWPTGADDGGFRLPNVLREHLRAQLVIQRPRDVHALHRLAAETQLDRKAIEEAIEHAFRAGETNSVIALLERHADELLRLGRMRALVRWLDALEADGLLADRPALRVARAWALMFTRHRSVTNSVLEALHGHAGSASDLQVLEATLSFLLDRADDPDFQLPEQQPTSSATTSFASDIRACSLACQRLLSGHIEQAVCILDGAGSDIRRYGSPFIAAYAEAVAGAADLIRGDLLQATVRLEQSMHSTSPNQPFGGNSMVAALVGLAYFESGREEDAERVLELHLPLATRIGLPDHSVVAHTVLARLAFRRGDGDGALGHLSTLEQQGEDRGMPRLVFSARLERVRLALLRKDHALALELLEKARNDEVWERVESCAFVANQDTFAIMEARVAIASGRIDHALTLLNAELQEASARGWGRRALTLRILLAEAMDRDGRAHIGARLLEDALRLGARQGYLAPFLDEGRGVRHLLLHFAQHYARTSRVPVDYLGALLGRLGIDAARRESGRPGFEPLTVKELQILRLLAAGLSNAAMGRRLSVSESTVRTHLRNINQKLVAGNRLEALAIARREGLIDI